MSSPYIQPSDLIVKSDSFAKFSWATASALEYCKRRDPTSIVCAELTKKLGEQMIRQPSIGWWERGEEQTDIPVGESAMWRRDVNEKKFYTTSPEDISEIKPYVLLRLICEYGSTRDEGGWTRQMVMYEENTPSPYPFKHDCFTEENDRYRRELTQNVPGLIHSEDMPSLIPADA
jgi:hypothetical protein